MKAWLFPTLAALALSSSAFAEEPAPGEPAPAEQAPEFHPKHGEIILGKNLAKLKVPENFGYLDPVETEKVLTELWGNPKSETPTLGMLVPMGAEGDDEDGGWGVVITYDDDGHVSDEDASKIDYNDLLKQMREASVEVNQERAQQGFPPVTLVGWATPPHYDASTRKLYWAKELAFGNHPKHTLNYNIRVLGKEGVLNLNAVASMADVARIEKEMPTVLGFVDFQPGNRYADFDSKTGRMAAYGIAGLVAGNVAMKAGLFKGLLAVLLAAKKLIIAGFAALVAAVSRLFKRKSPDAPPGPSAE